MITRSGYRFFIEENDSCFITRDSVSVHLRGPVDVKATFVLDVEHQISSIQVLHYKEEVLLHKQHITVSSL